MPPPRARGTQAQTASAHRTLGGGSPGGGRNPVGRQGFSAKSSSEPLLVSPALVAASGDTALHALRDGLSSPPLSAATPLSPASLSSSLSLSSSQEGLMKEAALGCAAIGWKTGASGRKLSTCFAAIGWKTGASGRRLWSFSCEALAGASERRLPFWTPPASPGNSASLSSTGGMKPGGGATLRGTRVQSSAPRPWLSA